MTVQIWARVSEETRKQIEAKAELLHRSLSEYVQLSVEYTLTGDKTIADALAIPVPAPNGSDESEPTDAT